MGCDKIGGGVQKQFFCASCSFSPPSPAPQDSILCTPKMAIIPIYDGYHRLDATAKTF